MCTCHPEVPSLFFLSLMLAMSSPFLLFFFGLLL
jgi:hypothetical protein